MKSWMSLLGLHGLSSGHLYMAWICMQFMLESMCWSHGSATVSAVGGVHNSL